MKENQPGFLYSSPDGLCMINKEENPPADTKMSDECRKEIMAKLLEAQKGLAEGFLRDFLGIYTSYIEDAKNKQDDESWRCLECKKYHFYNCWNKCQYCGKRIEGNKKA